MKQFKTKELELTLAEYRVLHDYFVTALNKPGISVDFSLYTAAAAKSLNKSQAECIKLMNENLPKKENLDVKYQQEMNEIVIKFADKDSDNKTIMTAEGRPQITNNIENFNKAINDLQEKYAKLFKAEQTKESDAAEYMKTTKIKAEFVVYDSIEDYPAVLEPAIIEILARII